MPKKIDNIDKSILELLTHKDYVTISELETLFGYSAPVLRKICKDIAVRHGFYYRRGVAHCVSQRVALKQ